MISSKKLIAVLPVTPAEQMPWRFKCDYEAFAANVFNGYESPGGVATTKKVNTWVNDFQSQFSEIMTRAFSEATNVGAFWDALYSEYPSWKSYRQHPFFCKLVTRLLRFEFAIPAKSGFNVGYLQISPDTNLSVRMVRETIVREVQVEKKPELECIVTKRTKEGCKAYDPNDDLIPLPCNHCRAHKAGSKASDQKWISINALRMRLDSNNDVCPNCHIDWLKTAKAALDNWLLAEVRLESDQYGKLNFAFKTDDIDLFRQIANDHPVLHTYTFNGGRSLLQEVLRWGAEKIAWEVISKRPESLCFVDEKTGQNGLMVIMANPKRFSDQFARQAVSVCEEMDASDKKQLLDTLDKKKRSVLFMAIRYRSSARTLVRTVAQSFDNTDGVIVNRLLRQIPVFRLIFALSFNFWAFRYCGEIRNKLVDRSLSSQTDEDYRKPFDLEGWFEEPNFPV